MKHVINIYKQIGQTPLQAVEEFRKQNPEYQKSKLGYAGRLDPMADGVLIILVGEENKRRKQYEALPKTYEFAVLFGLETDTYDVLGKLQTTNLPATPTDLETTIKDLLPTFIGKHTQKYPPYSSKPVNGKPLYYWARENKLSNIVIPTKEIEIYSLTYLNKNQIDAKTLQKTIHERIAIVTGNFRQKEILAIWDEFLKKNPNQVFTTVKLRIQCSSGTYVRSFAYTLGKKLGTGAIAFVITRIAIGE